MTSRLGVVLVALATAAGAAAVEASTIQVGPACGGAGFQGTLLDSGVELAFQSCATSDGVHVTLSAAAGVRVTELLVSDGTVQYWYGSVRVAPPHSPEELSAIEEVLDSPEAVLAPALQTALLSLGMDPGNPAMIALAAHFVGYERGPSALYVPQCDPMDPECCRDPETDCEGCCGLGCSGCGSSAGCTPECRDHDLCVRSEGHLACLDLLGPAIASSLGCDDPEVPDPDCW